MSENSNEDPPERKPREITRELYDRLVEAFREVPDNASRAGKLAGCDRRTAARAWARGWNDERSNPRLPWARPIQLVLMQEKAAARRQLAEDAKKKHGLDEAAYEAEMRENFRQASRDLAESRALVGKTVRASRHNAANLLAVSARLLNAAVPLAKHLEEQMSTGTWKESVSDTSRLLKDIAMIVRAATGNARDTDDMERRALGEPDFIVSNTEENFTAEEAVLEIEEANKALERSRKRGTVIVDAETVEVPYESSG